MCEARKRLRTWGKGIACACAVTSRVLLDAATYLTWKVASELDDMEGTSGAGGFLELIVYGVLAVPGRDPVSRSGCWSGSLLCALQASSCSRCQTFLGSGQAIGPWGDPPREWSHDAGEFTWVRAASVLVGVNRGLLRVKEW